MKIVFAARTDVGRVRERNEDSWAAWPEGAAGIRDLDAAVFAVADGMGGHPGGEVASEAAVRSVTELAGSLAEPGPRQALERIFESASRRIQERGHSETRYREMGTTLTVAVLVGGLAWVGHVGDSRLYWIRGNRQIQVTRDHTVAQDLVDSGSIAADQADSHPAGHVLTRCLGVCRDQHPDLLAHPLRLEAGDLLLLATDGLCKVLACERLAAVLSSREPDRVVSLLTHAALEGGGPDNITLIAVHVLETAAGPGEGTSFDEAHAMEWTSR